MSKVYIAFERVTEHFNKEKTVYINFSGDMEQAEEHLRSDEFCHFLTTSNGLNPRVVTEAPAL